MIAHTAKVMPILSSVLVRIGFFLTSCVGINQGHPSALGWENPIHTCLPQVLFQYIAQLCLTLTKGIGEDFHDAIEYWENLTPFARGVIGILRP